VPGAHPYCLHQRYDLITCGAFIPRDQYIEIDVMTVIQVFGADVLKGVNNLDLFPKKGLRSKGCGTLWGHLHGANLGRL